MAGVIPSEQARPEFKTGQMDAKGPWGWDYFNPIEMRELLQKIFDSQKLSWQDLRNQGSHLIDRKDLCSEAQKRLIQLQKDDLDQLFSLRLTGKKRIWGIKEGNILWMLWWDPNHEVCPSIKKHT
ncbi:MAG: hypothetical protein HY069_04205 [Chlamydiia bacterium]|nr:hypothetical protein [Chlamydiia bacterium]